MRFVEIIECRVKPGEMQGFVNAVQQWERSIEGNEAAPDYHEVLVDEDHPGAIAMILQFTDKEHADAFRATGLIDDFVANVLSCVESPATRRRYDLFYAAGEGPQAIFGETPHGG